ncbi:MAG: hypothetical protein IJD42_00555 [Clostridia bacterium]|nr:hypothetical protein [Clostridia bacterium]
MNKIKGQRFRALPFSFDDERQKAPYGSSPHKKEMTAFAVILVDIEQKMHFI